VTSKTTWVLEVASRATYVTLSFPPVPSALWTEFARVSPSGKLRVDVVGALVGAGVNDR
jgi:hypothetical protein